MVPNNFILRLAGLLARWLPSRCWLEVHNFGLHENASNFFFFSIFVLLDMFAFQTLIKLSKLDHRYPLSLFRVIQFIGLSSCTSFYFLYAKQPNSSAVCIQIPKKNITVFWKLDSTFGSIAALRWNCGWTPQTT